jgi:hypothetical protein
MDKVVIVLAVSVVAVVVAALVQRRPADAPARDGADHVPSSVDRADFGATDAPWMVVLFSSSTCDSCADVRSKAMPLASPHVVVVEATYQDDGALHRKYEIDAVPLCLLVDARGVVRRSFIGPVSSTHLWGALADLRDPGSVPQECGAADRDHTTADGSGERHSASGGDGTTLPGT